MDMESYLWGFFSREKECAETMKLAGYYSSGEFANKVHITKKTIRYYDEHNILKPFSLIFYFKYHYLYTLIN